MREFEAFQAARALPDDGRAHLSLEEDFLTGPVVAQLNVRRSGKDEIVHRAVLEQRIQLAGRLLVDELLGRLFNVADTKAHGSIPGGARTGRTLAEGVVEIKIARAAPWPIRGAAPACARA